MNVDDIQIGMDYRVRAVNVGTYEKWKVISKRQNKYGDWEIEARSSKTLNVRIFTPEQFKEVDKKMSNKIISESVKVRATLSDGTEIWEENMIYLPYQKRRGRKPKNG